MRKEELFYFVENYGSAFFVGSLVEGKLLYMNKKAKELFECDTDSCDFDKMFGVGEGVLTKSIEERLKNDTQSLIYNCAVQKANGETILVDVS